MPTDDFGEILQPLDWLTIEELGEKHAQPITGTIATPLPSWSAACRGEGGGLGLAPGWHITIGGGSGQGKSLAALNCAAHASLNGVLPAFLSYEMSRSQLVTRFLACVSGADVRRLEPGPGFDKVTWHEAAELWRQQRKAGFLLAERPPRTVGGLVALMRQCVEEHGAKLLIVDYLQLIGLSEIDTVYDRTLRVSGAIQEMAFTLGVTTMALSQFNRSQSFNRKDTPVNEGLSGGGAIENDSDQVLLLDHSSMERPDMYTGLTNLLLSKNRHGPMLKIPIRWDYRTLQMHERSSMSDAQDRIRRGAA